MAILRKSSSTLVAGTLRDHDGRWIAFETFTPYSRIYFSDWHCSIFESDKKAHLICGRKHQLELDGVPKSACSNNHFVYIATPCLVSAINKNLGTCSKLKSENVIQLGCSDDHVFCITEDNKLMELETKKDGTISLSDLSWEPPLKVRSLACGSQFALCLTLSGQVYSKGIGSRGQLGLGDLDDRKHFTLIEALQILTVMAVSTGTWHSCCLTDEGDVYTFGWNEHGQLGYASLGIAKQHSDRSRESTNLKDCVSVSSLPRPIDFPNEECISQIACGARHTVCLTMDQKLFAFGWNGHGQLGLKDQIQAVDQPTQILLDVGGDSSISSVSCGFWSTMILLDEPI